MNFRISQLQGFLVLAEHLHYARASRALCVSPPTLAFRVKSLEEGLSTKLFERTGKGLGLTEGGREFLPYAQRIIDVTEQALTCMEEYRLPSPLSGHTSVAEN